MGKDTMSAEEFFGDSSNGKSTGGSAEPRGKRARKGLFEEAKTRLVMRVCRVSKGRRFALPHARIMIHQPWGGCSRTATPRCILALDLTRGAGFGKICGVRARDKTMAETTDKTGGQPHAVNTAHGDGPLPSLGRFL